MKEKFSSLSHRDKLLNSEIKGQSVSGQKKKKKLLFKSKSAQKNIMRNAKLRKDIELLNASLSPRNNQRKVITSDGELEEIPEHKSQESIDLKPKVGSWNELVKIVGHSPLLGEMKQEYKRVTVNEVQKYIKIKVSLRKYDIACSICMGRFSRKPEATDCKILECQHLFHTACIEAWFKCYNQCPICPFDPDRALVARQLRIPSDRASDEDS